MIMVLFVVFWVSLIFYKKRNNLKDSEIMDHLAKDLAYGKNTDKIST